MAEALQGSLLPARLPEVPGLELSAAYVPASEGGEVRFVTVKLAYLRWDGDRVTVELASSGHPGPAVVRPDGRVEVLSGGGLPLGLFPDAPPECEILELGPEDLLFFYSDGVTEARNPEMEYF